MLEFPLSRDSILIVDRAYLDFQWLWHLNKKPIFFVTRLKKNIKYRLTGQHRSLAGQGILTDQAIELRKFPARDNYPEPLRLVKFRDEELRRTFKFLTNNFDLEPSTIAALYKSRWQVELFFKWIKQHLRIKAFYGTSENAVRTQIYIAITTYALVAIARKKYRCLAIYIPFYRF